MFIGWNERGPASMVSIWPPVMWPSSEPSAVVGGGGASDCAARIGRGIEAGDQADAGGFHIAFAARHLAGEAQPRLRAQPQLAVEQLRRIQEGVAMQAAEPGEFGVLQPGNGAEDALLRAVLQLGLEADDVVERAELVVLAQLHDGIGFHRRIVRVGEPDRLHRAVAQRLAAALGHHLDRQAAVEIGRVGFPVLEVGLFARKQRVDEGVDIAPWSSGN